MPAGVHIVLYVWYALLREMKSDVSHHKIELGFRIILVEYRLNNAVRVYLHQCTHHCDLCLDILLFRNSHSSHQYVWYSCLFIWGFVRLFNVGICLDNAKLCLETGSIFIDLSSSIPLLITTCLAYFCLLQYSNTLLEWFKIFLFKFSTKF